MEPTYLCNHIFTIPLISLVSFVPIACERFHAMAFLAIFCGYFCTFSCAFLSSAPDPHGRQLSPRSWRARGLAASLPAPPAEPCAVRTCSCILRSAAGSRMHRPQPAQHGQRPGHAARPRRPAFMQTPRFAPRKIVKRYSSPPALTGGRIDLPSLPPAIALPLAPFDLCLHMSACQQRWLLTHRGSLQVAV